MGLGCRFLVIAWFEGVLKLAEELIFSIEFIRFLNLCPVELCIVGVFCDRRN